MYSQKSQELIKYEISLFSFNLIYNMKLLFLGKGLNDKIMNSSNEVTENTNIVSSIQNELTSQQKVFNKIIFWFVFLLPLFIWIVLLYLAPKIENNDFLSFVRDYSNNVITGYTLAIITTILLKFFEKEEISKDFIYLSIFFYIILAIGLIVSYSTNNNLKIFDRSEHNSEL